MDTGTAVQSIKKDLESTFGAAMSTTILAMSRTKAKAPLIGMTKDDYLRLVDSIVTDKKVEQMLGASGAKEKQRKWSALI
jgi:hypothetical protein